MNYAIDFEEEFNNLKVATLAKKWECQSTPIANIFVHMYI